MPMNRSRTALHAPNSSRTWPQVVGRHRYKGVRWTSLRRKVHLPLKYVVHTDLIVSYSDTRLSSSDPPCRQGGDTAVQEWLPHRQDYLEELLRHEGRAGHVSCRDCSEMSGEFKCIDCFGSCLYCQACLLAWHNLLPFHRVKVYIWFFFRLYSETHNLGAMERSILSEHVTQRSRTCSSTRP